MARWTIVAIAVLMSLRVVAAEEPDDFEEALLDTVPGQIIITVTESSFEQFDRDGILERNLTTGLASLDELNQREGVVRVEPITRLPDPILPVLKRQYQLYFPVEVDVARLLEEYAQNEHVALAEPNLYDPTTEGGEQSSVQSLTWGSTKRSLLTQLKDRE